MQNNANTSIINKKIFNLWKWMTRVGFLHLLSANILIQIAGFGGQLFLTRIITVEDIGVIRVLQSYYSILIIVATFGINMSIMKICSEDIDEFKKRQIFSLGFYSSIVINTIVLSVFVYVINLGFFTTDKKVLKYLFVYNLQIPFFVLTSIIFSYYHSQKQVKLVSNFQSLTKISAIVVSVLLAIKLGVEGYIYGLVVCNALAFLLLFFYIKKDLVFINRETIKKIEIRAIFSTGIYSFGTNILWQLLLYLNIIMASYMVNNKEAIAFYGMAHLIVTTMMMIPMTLNQIMIPYISREAKNYNKVFILLKSYQKKMVLLILPLCIISYFIFPLFLPYILGEKYEGAGIYFKILLFTLFFWSLFSPKMNTLLAVGRIKYNFYTYIFSIIIYIILNIALMTAYGMLGAAIAISSTFFLTLFVNQYYFLKYQRESKF
ncbi:oligosaccharide flippase family protein [Priestia megaterium]